MAVPVGRRLAGKVSLVAGGASGIGRAVAIAFAREGAQVVVADGDLAGAEKTAREATAVGEATVVRLEVTRPAEVQATFAMVAERYDRLDVLACMLGIGLPEDGLVHETDPAVWDRAFGVKVRGTFLCCKYAVRQMLAQGGGVIVNAASLSGPMAGVHPIDDAGSSAVAQLSRVIALQYAAQNIRCNTVAPGAMATPLLAQPRFRALVAQLGPAGPATRPPVVRPEQVAAAVVFLASDESSYITGATFPVDAGVP